MRQKVERDCCPMSQAKEDEPHQHTEGEWEQVDKDNEHHHQPDSERS